MFFKNKHVITALIVAPILAFISYFAVDYYVAEVPHKAKSGELYKLLVKPNCRWESGQCDLVNGDLKLTITANKKANSYYHFYLTSQILLDKVQFSLVAQKDGHSSPIPMKRTKKNATAWQSLPIIVVKSDYLQFAITAGDNIFYAQMPAIFVYKSKEL